MQSSRRYGSKVVDNDNKLFIKLATGKIDNNVDKKDMYFSVANVKKILCCINEKISITANGILCRLVQDVPDDLPPDGNSSQGHRQLPEQHRDLRAGPQGLGGEVLDVAGGYSGHDPPAPERDSPSFDRKDQNRKRPSDFRPSAAAAATGSDDQRRGQVVAAPAAAAAGLGGVEASPESSSVDLGDAGRSLGHLARERQAHRAVHPVRCDVIVQLVPGHQLAADPRRPGGRRRHQQLLMHD